jgi:hypothetical protein
VKIKKETLMAIDTLRQTVANLNISAGALAALGAALDAQMSGVALEPKSGLTSRTLSERSAHARRLAMRQPPSCSRF